MPGFNSDEFVNHLCDSLDSTEYQIELVDIQIKQGEERIKRMDIQIKELEEEIIRLENKKET